MRKLTLQEHFTPEMTEGILMKSSARVRRIMSVGTMDTETIFTALLDEVWRVLLMKANARLKPASSAPNAEKIVCAFLKEGVRRSAVRYRFPGVFTIKLTNSRFKLTKDIPEGGGFSYRARPEGSGISSENLVSMARWMDSQIPLLHSMAEDMWREERQKEMIRRIKMIARKNGGAALDMIHEDL